MQHKTLPLNNVELKFAQSGSTFEGYASTFGGIDSYDDTILPGAYKSVIEAIKVGSARAPKMFVNHRSFELPVGRWDHLEEDSKGLIIRGEFTPGMSKAEEVKASLKHGTVDGLSIGYSLKDGDAEYVESNGSKIRVIKNISSLPEVSVVTFPADDSARVDLASVKSTLESIEDFKTLEDFLREVGGFSKSLATATVSRAKRIITRSDSEFQIPDELRRIIAENLSLSKKL